MKKIFWVLVVVVAALVLFYWAQAQEDSDRKIVVFREGVDESLKEQLLRQVGGEKLKDLDFSHAKVVKLGRLAAKNLAKNSEVLRVEDDAVAFIQAQVLPWGVNRVDAELVWLTGNSANPIKVGVIDTGISKNHLDLFANLKGGVNTINSRKSFSDDNGHGSHVAGTIGASNNTDGVVGVAPEVNLYAIKVLNANGSGFISDIIEGLQWAIANGMQVVNMSLGSTSNIQSLHDAVAAAKNAGIVVVAAAGNSGGSVIYPAAYPEAVAVSATDSNDLLAYFSSRGPEVDLAAPGVSIYSTSKGTGYATLSGTSMAAPHVAGAVALVLNMPVGLNDVNGNGKWDPDEVQTKLQNTATDLGLVGRDDLYGWGLVNAWGASN